MSERAPQENQLVQYMKEAEAVWMDQIPPETELHHRFSDRFLRKMRALLRYERRSVRMRRAVSDFRRLAAALLLILGIGGVLTLSVDAYRAKFFEIIMEVFPELTSIRTTPRDPSAEQEFEPVEPGYVPEGYEVEERIIDQLGVSIIYVNQMNQRIGYQQLLMGTGEVILDTENAKVETISLNEQEALAIEKDGFCILWWSKEPCEYMLDGEISLEDLKKMAKTLM